MTVRPIQTSFEEFMNRIDEKDAEHLADTLTIKRVFIDKKLDKKRTCPFSSAASTKAFARSRDPQCQTWYRTNGRQQDFLEHFVRYHSAVLTKPNGEAGMKWFRECSDACLNSDVDLVEKVTEEHWINHAIRTHTNPTHIKSWDSASKESGFLVIPPLDLKIKHARLSGQPQDLGLGMGIWTEDAFNADRTRGGRENPPPYWLQTQTLLQAKSAFTSKTEERLTWICLTGFGETLVYTGQSDVQALGKFFGQSPSLPETICPKTVWTLRRVCELLVCLIHCEPYRGYLKTSDQVEAVVKLPGASNYRVEWLVHYFQPELTKQTAEAIRRTTLNPASALEAKNPFAEQIAEAIGRTPLSPAAALEAQNPFDFPHWSNEYEPARPKKALDLKYTVSAPSHEETITVGWFDNSKAIGLETRLGWQTVWQEFELPGKVEDKVPVTFSIRRSGSDWIGGLRIAGIKIIKV